ncbi:hypothetical protein MKY09_11445 [Psychrobacillus sp. FSL K6-4046]|uniref:hypothetical protein n=1 Tax=Psychrobacillus sp. FSL K6-4046 TaxID=2921550 RepID=UPI00315A0E99
MNEIKKEIDYFIGKEPRFNRQLENRIKMKATEKHKDERYKIFGKGLLSYIMSFVLVASVFFLLFTVLQKDVEPTGNTNGESNSSLEGDKSFIDNEEQNELYVDTTEEDKLKEPTEEEIEEAKSLTNEVVEKFLLALSTKDRATAQSLLASEVKLKDNFAIEYGIYEFEFTFDYKEDVTSSELYGYEFIDGDRQRFRLFYDITFNRSTTYPYFLIIELVYQDGEWLIANINSDV